MIQGEQIRIEDIYKKIALGYAPKQCYYCGAFPDHFTILANRGIKFWKCSCTPTEWQLVERCLVIA